MSAPPILLAALIAWALVPTAAATQPASHEQQLRDTQRGLASASDPGLKVLAAEQAPAELLDVQLTRNFNGTPAVVYVRLHNRSSTVLNGAHVACYVFDAKPVLRLASFGVVNRPIPPSGERVLRIVVNRLESKPDWKIVVGLEDATVAGQRWANSSLRQQAEAALSDTSRDLPATPTLNPLAGHWTANVAASTLSAAYPVQSAAVEFTVDGDTVTATSDVVLVSGQAVHQAETFQVDGQEHAFERSPLGAGVLVTARWLSPRALETMVAQNGQQLAVATYEVSGDGQTLTAKTTGMVEQVLVFERK
jgi:hypothetical protein